MQMGTGYGDLSSDDYRPSPDWYNTPEASRVLSERYARAFNDLAAEFGVNGVLSGWYEYELREKAGKAIISAFSRGFLRSIPNLGKFVAWHTASDENDPVVGKDVQARRSRCPSNLFLDLIGGHLVNCHLDEEGKLTIIGPKPDDGILPAIDPLLFERGDAAGACRFLAETILHEAKTGTVTGNAKSPPPIILSGPGKPVIVRGKEKRPLTEAQYDVIEVLLAAGPQGLNKDELPRKSKHGDAVRVLGRIADIDADWKSVIGLAGKTGGGYRILDLDQSLP